MTPGIAPLVSVLMTVYNRENYIREAVESVLASSYENFELIIVDDGSTDNSLDIAMQYAANDKRLRVFKNDVNLKDYPNRNKAAGYARGKYLKYLDSDDAIFPEGLAYCIEAMEKFPAAGLGIKFYQKEYTEDDFLCWEPSKAIHQQFFVRGFLNIGPTGCIFRRDIFEQFGGFDTRFGVASDNYFNIRLAAISPVVLLPREFFFYRVHDGQEQKDKLGYLKNNHLYMKALLENITLPISDLELIQLKRKAKKSFSKELIRYLITSRKILPVRNLMRDTDYSFKEMFLNLI